MTLCIFLIYKQLINNFYIAFLMEVNKIIHGDCLKVLETFQDESIDLVFADPPYNLQLNKELYRPNSSRFLQ